jgi:hypothetical protein
VSGNGGTQDVSVMDLQKALAGAPVVKVAPRVPVQAGPFGIAASPNGKFVAVTAARTTGPASKATPAPTTSQSSTSAWRYTQS